MALRALRAGFSRLVEQAERQGAANVGLLSLLEHSAGRPYLQYSLAASLKRAGPYERAHQDYWRAFHAAVTPLHSMQPATASQEAARREQPPPQQQLYVTRQEGAPVIGAETKSHAEACDEVIAGLEETRTRVAEKKSSYNPKPKTLRQRVTAATSLLRSLLVSTANFIVSVPGRVRDFLALSKEERRERYRALWNSIKKEAHHYWLGTKLLGTDVKIASRLVFKAMQGKSLSRRERRQLTRTVADVFRLVPFAVFLLVPFMELLLPVALKLFPNMLPSTYEDKLKKEEELKKRVGVKLEVARFLQDTVQEMAKDMKKSTTGQTQASASQLYDFMKRVRAGQPISNYELMKFATLFNDELTLDNLERIHLINLCRFVGISPFGTDAFLVSRLRNHLREIRIDDRVIREEGIDSLTEEELRSASRARGMRAPFGEGAANFMRRQLTEWLDLSLNRSLPSSLLLLSRAFTVTQPLSGTKDGFEGLKDTLSSLPKEVIDEIAMQRPADGTDLGTEYSRKLEQLRREEELIHEEELEAEGLEDTGIKSSENAQEMTAAAAASAIVREAAASAVVDALEGMSEEEKSAKLAAAKEAKMRKVISALAVLASSSGVSSERAAFMDLVKVEVERLNDQLESRGGISMIYHNGGVKVDQPGELQEVVGQSRLADKVTAILGRIERELDSVDSKIGESMHVLDLDNDGLITKDELQTAMSFLRDQLGEDELRMLLERLNAFTEDSKPIDVKHLMQLAGGEGGSGEQVASAG